MDPFACCHQTSASYLLSRFSSPRISRKSLLLQYFYWSQRNQQGSTRICLRAARRHYPARATSAPNRPGKPPSEAQSCVASVMWSWCLRYFLRELGHISIASSWCQASWRRKLACRGSRASRLSRAACNHSGLARLYQVRSDSRSTCQWSIEHKLDCHSSLTCGSVSRRPRPWPGRFTRLVHLAQLSQRSCQ